MTVKVITKRTFQMDAKKKLISLLAKLRSLSKGQPGHISRETLKSLDNPGEYIVISEWETAEDWKKWLNNEQRSEVQGEIDSLIGEKTFYELFEPELF